MARDLKLAMTLLARDQGSKVLRQALADINRQINTNKKVSDDAARSEQENIQNTTRASRVLQQEYRRAASARETLGIRSERTIQREIAQTQAAYMRLLRTGTMSAQEQSRAFDAMTRKVAGLRNELTGAGQAMSRFERMRNWGSNATAIVGGVAAAGAIVAPSINNQMSYEYRLADMANTAFPDDDVTGKHNAMGRMDQLIRKSVAVGGGNKDSASETLATLLNSGQVEYNSAEKLLPVLQKYATATGADPQQFAEIAIRLKQNFGISDEQIPTALNMAIKSGQLGSFEVKDLAKWLPNQLASAGSLGMRGLGDLGVILGLDQVSMSSAGTTDEAGNNVVNLLQKINSQDAANAAKRIQYNGKGIDLPGSIAAARGRGMNAIEAFSGIVDKVVGNNPQYKHLEQKLRGATNDSDKREIMESQRQFLEGSSIGQVIADRQALMALIAWRGQKQYRQDVIDGTRNQIKLPIDKQAGEQSFELIKGTNLFKVGQLNNTRDFAQMDSVKSLSDITGKLSQDLNDYAGAYPGLTKAMAGAELAIKAMTAAAWAFAGIKFLSSVAGKSAMGASVPEGGLSSATATAGGLMGKLARVGGKIAAPIALWQAAEDAPLIKVERGDQAARSRLQSGKDTDTVSRLRDLKTGQPGLLDVWDEVKSLWSPAQGLKNAASGDKKPLTASDNGAVRSDDVTTIEPSGQWDGVKSWWSPPTAIQMPTSANGYAIPPFAQPAPATPQQPQLIQLTVDGKVLAEAVNNFNSHNGSRGPQGGPH